MNVVLPGCNGTRAGGAGISPLLCALVLFPILSHTRQVVSDSIAYADLIKSRWIKNCLNNGTNGEQADSAHARQIVLTRAFISVPGARYPQGPIQCAPQ